MTTLRKGAFGIAVASCLGIPLVLTGCTASDPGVFGTHRTVIDSLPQGVTVSGIDPSSVHFLGTHGSVSYYAAEGKDPLVGECLVSVPVASVSNWVAACGHEAPVTVTADGVTARLISGDDGDIPTGWAPAGPYLIVKSS